MRIAEVAEEYGISADTLRYYERIGLLPRVHRNASGIRDYDEDDCMRVSFIKCMRGANVSIEAVSYTHLDVYKRQTFFSVRSAPIKPPPSIYRHTAEVEPIIYLWPI